MAETQRRADSGQDAPREAVPLGLPAVAAERTPAAVLPGVGARVPPFGVAAGLSPATVLALQRSAGNASVTRALGASRPSTPARCACGGTIGADGLCDRCRALGKTAVEPRPAQTLGREPADAPQTTLTDATGLSATTTGTLSSATLPGGERLCLPPGPIMGPQWGSGFGTLAERFIEQDYCTTLGCSPATDYFDNYNPTEYLNFMRAHNPTLTSGAAAVVLAAAAITGIARPDILTDNAARREYYEVKPFSPTGVSAGMEKLVEIMTFMASLSLPYVPGVTYGAAKDIPMWSGMVLGDPLGVALNVQRPLPGLVVYSLCLRGNLSSILAKVTLAALLAWLIAEILGPILVVAAA